MGLKSLEGFIKFPDGFAAAPVILTPRDWPRRAEGFVPREDARKPVGPGSKTSEPAATANADGACEGSDSDGDPRKMKDRTDSRRPSRQRGKSDAAQIRKSEKDGRFKGDWDRTKYASNNEHDRAETKAHRSEDGPRQSELPLTERLRSSAARGTGHDHVQPDPKREEKELTPNKSKALDLGI